MFKKISLPEDWSIYLYAGLFVLFVLGIVAMVAYYVVRTPPCSREFRIPDPALATVVLAMDLEERGLLADTDQPVEYGWRFDNGDLKLVVQDTSYTYIGRFCLTGDTIEWRDVEVIPNDTG